MKLLAVVALCAAAACSGSTSNNPGASGHSGGGDGDGDVVSEPDKARICDDAMSRAEAAHQEAWDAIVARGAPRTLEDLAAAACQRFCGRSTECAIEEACLTLPAAEIADLQLDKTAPENTRQCLERCNASRMTKEQIQILGNCAQDTETTCAEFRACSAAAQPAE